MLDYQTRLGPAERLEAAETAVTQLEDRLASIDAALPALEQRAADAQRLADAARAAWRTAAAALQQLVDPRPRYDEQGRRILEAPERPRPRYDDQKRPIIQRDDPEPRRVTELRAALADAALAHAEAGAQLQRAARPLRAAQGERSRLRAALQYQRGQHDQAAAQLAALSTSPSRESRARALLSGIAQSMGIGGP